MKKNKSFIIILSSFIVLSLISLLAFGWIPAAFAADIEAILDSSKMINESSQFLLVTNNNSSSFTVKVYAWEKKGSKWKKAFEPLNGVIGKNGFARPGEKREGDGRTPSGIYPLQMTFGYDKSIQTKMPYRQALPDDLWIDDANATDYNRWVKKGQTHAVSFEKMRRIDDLYKYGIIIEYNTSPVIKGHGSAIFFHVWAGEEKPTAGCVAISENDLVKLLGWLNPQAKPLIITGTEDNIYKMPERFVDIRDVIPDVQLDIRYFGPHNFAGERIDGYNAAKCIITREAAEALTKVQKDIKQFSLSIKIYDCYRPQRAVNHFVKWATEIGNTKTKKEFYPAIDKRNLFKDGYIDSKSGHSRGSTVDLTIVPIPTPAQGIYIPGQKLYACYLPAQKRFEDNSIDMGTGFDCFHELSHTENKNIGLQQRINRMLLKSLMEKHGFRNFEKEWWHYTLNNEPYPATYFDFVIE